jgi:hypothetical protein
VAARERTKEFQYFRRMTDENKNLKITGIGLLIKDNVIASFQQIFKNKHITISATAKLINKSPVTVKKYVENPREMRVADIIELAQLFEVTFLQMSKIIWHDVKEKAPM